GLVVFMTGVALPLIAEEFDIGKTQHGLVSAASLFGILIGALVLGGLSDRFGRKFMFIAEMVIFLVFLMGFIYECDLAYGKMGGGLLPTTSWSSNKKFLGPSNAGNPIEFSSSAIACLVGDGSPNRCSPTPSVYSGKQRPCPGSTARKASSNSAQKFWASG